MSLIALPDGSVRPEVLANPYGLYARLRAQAPAVFDTAVNGWLVSRYDDVRALALDERLLASRSRSYFGGLPLHEQERFGLFRRTRAAMLLYADAATHTRIRRTVARALHDCVAALGPAAIERHVQALVTHIAESRDEIDLVRDLAEPLPTLVLTDLLGLPQDEAAAIYHHSAMFSGALGGVIRTHRVQVAEDALRELRPRLDRLATQAPAGSVLARLTDALHAGDLSEDELVASAVVLVIAGHETTTNLIGNTLIALARNPDVQELALSSDVLTRRVVDEVLRFDTPVQTTAREAREDLQLGQQTISSGDRVVLLFGSANRDSAVFELPDTFDPDRAERRAALSFGIGPHHCPGSGLARMQAELAVRVLLRTVGPIRLSREPVWKSNFSFRGPAVLGVSVGG